MPRLNLFRKARVAVENGINRVASRLRPPREEPVAGPAGPSALPGEVIHALGQMRAERIDQRRLVPSAGTALTAASAVRKQIDVPGADAETLGVSQDERTGVLQWHRPHVDVGEGVARFEIWLRRAAKEGRDAVFVKLPKGDPLALVQGAEAATKKQGIKRFPRDLPHGSLLLPQADEIVSIPPGGPAVLLVHGFFDRLFGFIFLPMYRERLLLDFLHTRYPGRVFGYDHYTVSVDPVENARILVDALPKGLELDIVCHSRGGLVTRCLLQHPDVRARVEAKGIRVRNVVFVGAANQGTLLARPEHFPKLASIFSTLMLKHPERAKLPEAASDALMTLFVRSVQGSLAPALTALPGVAALAPECPLIQKLNQTPFQPSGSCSVVRSDFGKGKWFPGIELARIANTVFGGAASDLVVPFDGVANLGPAGGHVKLHDIPDAGGCNHLEFMLRQDVQRFICDRLSAS